MVKKTILQFAKGMIYIQRDIYEKNVLIFLHQKWRIASGEFIKARCNIPKDKLTILFYNASIIQEIKQKLYSQT